ncbi:MAG: PilZ domain-containing protein [Acidobacteriia bacterium]|nr:PilZ domain-containing protein [Terriglobia bacterium]
MNKRREPRFEADQSVVVTVLGDHELRHAALVKNASGRGIAIEMPAAVAIGAALKIECDDSILLGEAVYCKAGPGSHLVGVELDQMLCGLTELGKRLQEFAAEAPSGREVPYAIKHRQRQHRQEPQQQ